MLPVTVEESKAQRIQRQQARFRDRGGAFVPSEKNPLIDILLSRTISGESPSKLVTKSPYRHRNRSISPSKAKRDKKASKPQESLLKSLCSNTNADAQAGLLSGNAVAGPSTESVRKAVKTETKKKAATTRKGRGRTKTSNYDDVPEVEKPKEKPPPKRRGRPPKTKALASDPGIGVDPEPPKRKTKTSKAKPPGKSKTRTKLAVAPQSDDDDDTLVEAPRLKGQSKRKPVIVTINSDGEDESIPVNGAANANPSLLKSPYRRSSAKDAPLNRAKAKGRTEAQPDEAEPMVPTEASQTRKHPKRAEANEESPGPVESRTYASLTVEIPMKKSVISSKRSAPDGRDPELEQPTKRAKVIKLQSAKSMPLSNSTSVSKPNTEDTTVKKPSSAMKKDTNRKKARPPESDDEDHLPKKPAPKRARFVEESKPLVQISSEKQKENVVSRKAKIEKPASKSKSRGPPKNVLDRIKASVTVIDDSDADPLDCLS
ncbi:hypothetical protein M405DRAFT_879976 [Rhizopogon salebrosus TDB-379]|nr:hypothetical protein M405DRAFT_879976 [Rhizopogon salebrosus TDB-379]